MKPSLVHLTRDYPPPFTGGLSAALWGLSHHLDRFEHGVVSFDRWRPRAAAGFAVSRPDDALWRVVSGGPVEGSAFDGVAAEPDLAMVHDPLLPPDPWAVPHVYVAHVLHAEQNRIRGVASTMSSSAEKRWMDGADLVIAPSTAAGSCLIQHYPSVSHKMSVAPLAPNIVSSPEAPLGPEDVASRSLLFVGRLDALKGLDLLLSAWSTLAPRWPDFTLEVVGGMPHRPEVLARWKRRWHAEHPALVDRVCWWGWLDREEVHRRMQEATLVITPSRFETYGYAIAEAVALGTPVVAARVGIVPDLEGRPGVETLAKIDAPTLVASLGRAMGSADDSTLDRPSLPASLTWSHLADVWQDQLIAMLG